MSNYQRRREQLVRKMRKWYLEAQKNKDYDSIRAYRRRIYLDEGIKEKEKTWEEIVGIR